ncbi:winged helix DNA-binding domain-containing protein [Nocardia terpenica]|uniref:Winged helix DNA-binding domain-containing protein n=1 Tax=Nocardia terpenica TaxID=455432 RepID=A0A6G9Z688_9NOCA|nr:winged helix DNA-binding domain-containing protein [Nocardia terpenica]QIS21125.1 winged helix DNA-binding domain-containing protein [Nocardia terpenica]
MSATMPVVTDEQRRALLMSRHRHVPYRRAACAADVADAVLGLHATDPATVYLSAAARLAEPRHDDIERVLYDRSRLLRLTGMRGTLFVVPTELAPTVLAATGRTHAAVRTAGLLRVLEQDGLGDHATLTALFDDVLALLRCRGEMTTREIAAEIPVLQKQLVVSAGKSYESRRSLAVEVSFVMAADGRIVRAGRRGGWTSTQHAWAVAPALPEIPVREARAELAHRWLAAFGPGTVADLKWWTGWTVTDTRKALRDSAAVEVSLQGEPGYALESQLGPLESPEPAAVLLPALDPTPMGWRNRDFYLDPAYVPSLFDRMGNIGPTIWWNGRIVGGWAQCRNGTLAARLLIDPGRAARKAIDTEIDRVAGYLADRRFTPAYRTPLERDLAGH